MNGKSFKIGCELSWNELFHQFAVLPAHPTSIIFFSSCFTFSQCQMDGTDTLLFKRLLLTPPPPSELSVSIQPFHLSLPATQERQQLWSQDKPQQNLRLFNRTEERKINFLCQSRCCSLKCAQLSSGFESSVPNTKIHPCNCCRKAQLPNWLFSHNCHLLGEALLWSCTAAAFKMATTFHHFILLSVDLCDVIPVRAL